MTEILLIRHGETEWNAERRLQGHLDIGLNQAGRRQAELLAQTLRSEHLDAVIASDLQRALHTAQTIAAPRAMTVTIDPALRERCFGAFEGLLYDDIGVHFPVACTAWKTRDLDTRYPPGERIAETLREFSARAVAAVLGHAQRHHGQKIAILTHGGVLDCLYRAALGIDLEKPRDFDITNTAINRFGWNEGTLQLLRWGDVSHLARQALDEMNY